MNNAPSATDDRGPMFLKANWIGVGFGVLFVGARVFTRINILGYLSLDDYLMVISLIFGIVNTALNTAAVNAGLGKHVEALRPEQHLTAFRYQYIIQPFAYLALIFGRISFAVSLMLLIGIERSRRWFLNALIIGQLVVNLIWVGLWLGQCNPPEKFWNRQLPGTCMDPRIEIDAGYLTLSFNIFTDLALAVLPSIVVSNLQMRLRTKVGLIFLMGLGILNMVAAIITAVEISKIQSSQDFTYDFILVDYWGIVQTYLAIVAASAPFIRPLFRNVKAPDVLRWTFYTSILHRHRRHSTDSPQNEENLTLPSSEHSHSHLPHVRMDRFVTTTLKGMVVEDETDSIGKSEKLEDSKAVLSTGIAEQGIRQNGECV